MSSDADSNHPNAPVIRRLTLLLAPLAGLLLTHGLAVACLIHCLLISPHLLHHCHQTLETAITVELSAPGWLVEGGKTPLAALPPISLPPLDSTARQPEPVAGTIFQSINTAPEQPPPRLA